MIMNCILIIMLRGAGGTCEHGVGAPQLGIRDVVALALGEALDLAARKLKIFAGAPAGQRRGNA
jgi:hypothetical protein